MLRNMTTFSKEGSKHTWEAGEKLAKHWNEAITIAGLKNKSSMGGVIRCQLDMKQINALMDLGVLDKFEYHNEAPTIWQFYQLGKRFKDGIIFEGYFVEPRRDDCRISIDCVYLPSIEHMTPLLRKYWKKVYIAVGKWADEFWREGSKLRIWWD